MSWCSPQRKTFGYSLLEVAVSMLLFGLILLISANTLLGIISVKRNLNSEQEALQLAHNLMETLMALPIDEAKSYAPEEKNQWTANQRYAVSATWDEYEANRELERITLEYSSKERLIVRLTALHPR